MISVGDHNTGREIAHVIYNFKEVAQFQVETSIFK